MKKVCCICGAEFEEFGNNPEPIRDIETNGERNCCCDWCNDHLVNPLRDRIDWVKNGVEWVGKGGKILNH